MSYQIDAQDHLSTLLKINHLLIKTLESNRFNKKELLLKKPNEYSWNALECFEHLCRYGDFYLPNFKKSFKQKYFIESKYIYKSGFIGGLFVKSMKIKSKNPVKKFSSPKEANPIFDNQIRENVLQNLMDQLKTLSQIIEQSQSYNINKIKTPISISRFIKINLGDALAVFIFHAERHIEQAIRAIK